MFFEKRLTSILRGGSAAPAPIGRKDTLQPASNIRLIKGLIRSFDY
jgi:hypothetical protein